MTLFYLDITPRVTTPDGFVFKCATVRYEIETKGVPLAEFEKFNSFNAPFLGDTGVIFDMRLVPAVDELQPSLRKRSKAK